MTHTNERPTDINGKPYNRPLLVAVMLVGAFVTILNQTLLSTALPHIMKDLDILPSTGQWLTTAFMLTNGIMIPLTALLIEKISSKTLFLFAMISFAIGTIICAISSGFEMLIIGRIIQAVGAGIMMPLLSVIFLTIFPIERRGAAMGMVGLVIAFAPAIGPTVGGWIVDTWDWHYLFYIVFPIVILDIIFALFAMKNIVKLTNPKIDVLSVALSTIGFGAFLYGFSSAGNDGWTDSIVLLSIAVGIIGIGLFTWRQLSLPKPMLELRVFKSKVFLLTTIMGGVLFMSMIGSSMILPIYIQQVHGKTALYSGLILLPGALLMGVMGPITGRIYDKFGARWLAIVGLTILTLSTIPFMFLHEDTAMWWIAVVYAVRFLGISMVMMPLTTAGINSLPMKQLSHGNAVNNTLRQISGSIGTAVLITILSNVMNHNMPDKAMAMTDPLHFKKEMIDATLLGINASFFSDVNFIIPCFIFSLFLK
ncbi:MDR family MFS transporter [Bacillus massiliigorillae]|uniref:MDR family MFS transporter n=1 Tax=Bacillus massiliigorillae TaxID=1243664 RepID=UPI00039ACCFA|nr:MDR family MFS transporter [Bacillus massiliigorillae]